MKHIALIALGEKTSYFCRDQLHRLLGNRINISNYYAEGNLPQRIKADLPFYEPPCLSEDPYASVRWPALYDFSAFHQLP